MKTKPSTKSVLGLAAALAFLIPAVTMAASTVTFDNQSGKSALVKLVGPTASAVTVENSKKESVSVVPGHYFIKVRYGTPGAYSYSKGDEFDVTETATAASATTITLHKVIAGNYGSKTISEKDFDAAPVTAATTPPPTIPATKAPFQFKPGALCKSDDGKLDGVLIHHTPVELKNAKDFADPDSLITGMILMGQFMPEWGIFENKPQGRLLAIGEGISKGPEGAVFRAVTTGAFPKAYDFIEGALYVVTTNEPIADSGVIRLRRKKQ